MAKQFYVNTKFRAEARLMINKLNDILDEYIGKYVITARTLYYQCVARGIIPNSEESYKKLTNLVSEARLAGLMDWDVITDRGREVLDRPKWGDGPAFLRAVLPQYHTDLWDNQPSRVFVVVEKDALAGVIERTCQAFDVPLLAAKGYPSSSALREMAKRFLVEPAENGQRIVILHMGDHDPSGINMSTDLEDRLHMFTATDVYGDHKDTSADEYMDFYRIALNMAQVREVDPPPNPAKITDPRAKDYIRRFGNISWELDALSPQYLNNLLRKHIEANIDDDAWKVKLDEIATTKKRLGELVNMY
jgi:hypothetical protein